MYVLYRQINDYDQLDVPAVVFKDKPTSKQLKEVTKEIPFINNERISCLLAGKKIFGTRSNEAEDWGYCSYHLDEVKEATWIA